MNNLKQLGLALHSYHSANATFPAGTSTSIPQQCVNVDCRGNSMYTALLPYLEQSALTGLYNDQAGWGWSDTSNQPVRDTPLAVYRCPSVSVWNDVDIRRDYFGVVGGSAPFSTCKWGDVFLDGLFNINRWVPISAIHDGTSQTLAMGESVHAAKYGLGSGYGDPDRGGTVPWVAGGDCIFPCKPNNVYSLGRGLRPTKHPINSSLVPMPNSVNNEYPFGSEHAGLAAFVYADGHVDFLNDAIDMDTYQALSTHKGREER